MQHLSLSKAHARRRRAATLVEYALILVGVLLIGAGAMKLLGSRMSTRLDGAGGSVSGGSGGSGGGNGGGSGGGSGGSGGGSTAGGGGGAGGAGGGGAGGAGGGGVAGKSNAASKASLGGGASSDDLNGGGGRGSAQNGGSGGGGGAGGSSSSSAEDDHGVAATLADGDMDSPRMKRLMAICFLISGSAALGYYAFKAKKAATKKPD